MAKSNVVVGQIQGQVWMRDASGNLLELRTGMEIPADAVLVKASGSEVVLLGDENIDSQSLEGATTTASAEAEQADTSIETDTADAGMQDVASLITALNAGKDIFEDLDPTEAVLEGDAGAGGMYTKVASVNESTSPMSLQYGVAATPQLGDNAKLGGSVAGDARIGDVVDGGGGSDGGGTTPDKPQNVMILIPKSTDDLTQDSSIHYAFWGGAGKPGKAYIYAPAGIESITFVGEPFPLDNAGEWNEVESGYARVIFIGTQTKNWDDVESDEVAPWPPGSEVYELDFIFIMDGYDREYPNGPIVEEFWFEITTSDGETFSYPLRTETFDPALPPPNMNPASFSDAVVVETDEEENNRLENDEEKLSGQDGELNNLVWIGDGGDLDFSGSELSEQLKHVDVLDLTGEGAAHNVSYLGVDDVLNMSGGKDILTILADGDDSIGFDTKDVWTLNAQKSASGDFNVFEGVSKEGELVQVRISKGFESLSGLAEPQTAAPTARSASAPAQPDIDLEAQQMLAMQVLDQAKTMGDQL